MDNKWKFGLAICGLIIIAALISSIIILNTTPKQTNNKKYICEQNCVVTLDDNPKTEGLYIENQHLLIGSYAGKDLNKNQIARCCKEQN